MVLGPFDEVGHDQEVAGEAHLLDDAQLEIQPLLILLERGGMGDDRKAGLQALVRPDGAVPRTSSSANCGRIGLRLATA